MIPGLASIIVLNWNGKNVIFDCLDSLLAQPYAQKEIILVDNGSRDGSLEMIREKYSGRIKIIENPENLGFAGGCNTGMRASQGEWIALINSDSTVEKNWIEEMIKGIRQSVSIGMVACKIYFWGKDKVLENTGQIISRDGLGRTRGRLEKDTGQYDHRSAVLCPSGCAALYRRSMLDLTGFFDEKFFAYADDIDIGLRGRLAGYKCFYVPEAVAYHKLSASFGLLSPFKAFLVERNRLWVVIKCFPRRHLLVAPFHTVARYFFHLYGIFGHKGPAARYVEKISLISLLWIMVRVYLSTLWFLPHLIKERFQIKKNTRTTPKQFELWLKQYGLTDRQAALNEISYED